MNNPIVLEHWEPWIEIANHLQNLGNGYSARCEFNDLIKNAKYPQ